MSFKRIDTINMLSPDDFFDWLTVACACIDREGNLTAANKAWTSYTGMISLNRFEAFLPDFQPCGTSSKEFLLQHVKDAIAEGVSYFELVFGKDFEKSGYLYITLKKTAGDLVFAVAHNERETNLHQQLALLGEAMSNTREAERLNEIFIDYSPLMMNMWDEEYNLMSASRQVLDVLSLETPEEYSSKFLELCPKFQPCGTLSEVKFKTLINKGFKEGYAKFEWMHQTLIGEPVPVEVTLIRFYHKGKKRLIAYLMDLRPIKAAMARERELEREITTIEDIKITLEAAPIAITIYDANHNLIDCNPAVVKLFGFNDKDAFIQAFAGRIADFSPEFQPCGTRSVEKLKQVIKNATTNGSEKFEWIHLNLHGEEIHSDVSIIRVSHRNSYLLIVYQIDLSEMKAMQAKERETAERAQKEQNRLLIMEESNKAKSLFLARMSHEIRTPITSVLGISDIQLHNPKLPPDMVSAFTNIQNSSNLLLGIINDILDLSKIEAGKMTILNERYSVESIINDIAHLHLAHFESKNISFKINVDDSLPEYLNGDNLRISQIINNLLSNSFKYTDSGNVEFSIRRKDNKNENYITLEILIKDTGMGMTKKQVAIIYDEYSRFHENVDRYISGSGLGMPIVYSLVQLMNAEINIESEVGVGTTVVVSIPQKVDSANLIGKESAVRLEKFEAYANTAASRFKFVPESMSYARVLAVDDVPANLHVVQGLLAFYDLNLETCNDGYEAIEKITSGNEYDLIFMDHMMPGINGTETMHRIRKTGYSKPIVILTANAMMGQDEVFIKEGFDDFISKPIQTKQLNTILIKHIRDKQPPEVLEAEAEARKLVNKDNDGIGIEDFQKDDTMQNKLKADFAKNQRTAVDNILQALNDGDIELAHRLAHTLKGLAALIFESRLSNIAEVIEDSIEKEIIPSQSLMMELEEELNRVIENIQPATKKNASSPSNADIALAIEELDKLKPLLDFRKAESISLISELKKVPEATVFVKQVEKFDFATAAKSLSTLKDVLEEL